MTSRPTPLAAPSRKQTSTRVNTLRWIFEPLERDTGYACRKMFGCDAAYMDGALCLVVADRGDPWNGLLVCTSHEHHEALTADVPGLSCHEVLGKWLYLPQHDEHFETVAARLVDMVGGRDHRIGVHTKPRKRSR